MKIVAIIQARLYSTRLPGKVLMTVGGIPMVKRVWLAAKASRVDQVVVAWPERYPDLDENNVLERFRRIAKETKADTIVRLTADCPLITAKHINNALDARTGLYYNNYLDGYDVQIFPADFLYRDQWTDKEHVIRSVPNFGGDSVNSLNDLCRIRALAAKSSSVPAVQEHSAEPLQSTS